MKAILMEQRRSLSNYKAKQYTKNFDYFNAYLAGNRYHQLSALWAIVNRNIGQIISPCGTGKTQIQTAIHIGGMIQLIQDYEYGVFVIASHRLMLNKQLLDQVIDLAVRCGLPFDVLYVGSYKSDLNSYYAKYRKEFGYTKEVSRHLATTDGKKIEAFVQNARDNFRNVIIASTYKSFAALKNIGTINITTFDEAHNITQKDFNKNILEVKPNILAQYFFTATRKTFGDDGGMNDKNFYGDVIFDANPKSMIEEGEIVEPRLHKIGGANDETTNATDTHMLVKNTIESFEEHKGYIKGNSCSPNNIGAKLLIGCDGVEEMGCIYNDPMFKKFVIDNNIKTFSISSEGGSNANWSKCGKEDFFAKLTSLSDSEDAVIFNVDMLTEGIDLPSITGVMPLRNLGLTKLIQLIGRAIRLHRLDRKRLYGKEIEPQDVKSFIKPYGYLIIPRHLASLNHHQEMINIASAFYSEYGTIPDKLIVPERFIDHQPNELKSMIPFNFKNGKDYDLEHQEFNLVEETKLHFFRDKMSNINRCRKNKIF